MSSSRQPHSASVSVPVWAFGDDDGRRPLRPVLSQLGQSVRMRGRRADLVVDLWVWSASAISSKVTPGRDLRCVHRDPFFRLRSLSCVGVSGRAPPERLFWVRRVHAREL